MSRRLRGRATARRGRPVRAWGSRAMTSTATAGSTFWSRTSGARGARYTAIWATGFLKTAALSGIVSRQSRLGRLGMRLADFDSDGWLDCFVTTGHVDDNLHRMSRFFHQYAQPPLLHRNQSGKGFKLATRMAGDYFDEDHVGRGVAQGDLDNDGDIDLIINHKDAPPAFLRNDTASKNHWIRLELEGSRSNRDGVGARVEVRAGNRTMVRRRKGGGSYASAGDPRLLIGLGEATWAAVTIRWPSGQMDQFNDLAAETSWRLREGEAVPVALPVEK